MKTKEILKYIHYDGMGNTQHSLESELVFFYTLND